MIVVGFETEIILDGRSIEEISQEITLLCRDRKFKLEMNKDGVSAKWKEIKCT